jgi:hypothetical protein
VTHVSKQNQRIEVRFIQMNTDQEMMRERERENHSARNWLARWASGAGASHPSVTVDCDPAVRSDSESLLLSAKL